MPLGVWLGGGARVQEAVLGDGQQVGLADCLVVKVTAEHLAAPATTEVLVAQSPGLEPRERPPPELLRVAAGDQLVEGGAPRVTEVVTSEDGVGAGEEGVAVEDGGAGLLRGQNEVGTGHGALPGGGDGVGGRVLPRDQPQEGGGLGGVARPPTLVGEALNVAEVVDLVLLEADAAASTSLLSGTPAGVALTHDLSLQSLSSRLSLLS